MSLAACATSLPRLQPSEVLQRSILESQTVISADFSLQSTVDIEDKEGKTRHMELTWSGALSDRGQSLRGLLDARVDLTSPQGKKNVRASGEVRMIADQFFIRLGELSVIPSSDAMDASVRSLKDHWWKIRKTTGGPVAFVTPDQHWTARQLKVVRVDRELDDETVDASRAYHYEVSIDAGRLDELLSAVADDDRKSLQSLKARGQLTIDARTFLLQKAVWHIDNVFTGSGRLTADIDIGIHAVNQHQTVAEPPNAEEFDMSAMRDWDTISR